MPAKLAVALRVWVVAVALGLGTVRAAEPASPLLGATREQVLARLGEPRSQIDTGDRLVFFYPRERVIFRGNVVVEVEAIVPEPVRRPPPPPPETTTPAPGDAATPATPSGTPSTVTPPPAGPAPTAPTPTPAPQTPVPQATTPTAPPEPKFGIKRVIPPGTKDVRTAPPLPEPVAVPVTPPPEPTPAPVTPPVVDPKAEEMRLAKAAAAREALEAKKAAERAAAIEKEKKDKVVREARRRLDAAAELEAGDGSSTKVWLIAGAAVASILGFFMWRARQRRIELDVSSVTNVPTAAPASAQVAPAAPAPLTTFSADMLGQLDAKRFEAVVAAYYSKTGIVANSTQAAAGSPVHIKISWKGESRPFAYVQCIAQPPGPIEVKPLRDLIAVLAADDIRRGYIVTSGTFSVAARDLAQQKQLTLMSGEAFLEKLNTLPTAARKEIIQEVGLV